MTRDRNNKECRFRSQTFLEDQGVEAVRVVAGEGFGNTVDVAFVEGQGRDVVDGGFEFDDAAGGGTEAIFGGFEQERSDAEAAGGGDYVDGDNVAAPMVCGLGTMKPAIAMSLGVTTSGFRLLPFPGSGLD